MCLRKRDHRHHRFNCMWCYWMFHILWYLHAFVALSIHSYQNQFKTTFHLKMKTVFGTLFSFCPGEDTEVITAMKWVSSLTVRYK